MTDVITMTNPEIFEAARKIPQETIAYLRESVPPKSTFKSWMCFLDDYQLGDVFLRLQRGDTHRDIITYCKIDFGIRSTLRIKDMLPDLVTFKSKIFGMKSIIEDKNVLEAYPEKTTIITKTIEGLAKKLNGMDKLAWLIEEQSKRVSRLLTMEAKGLPLAITNDTIQILGKLLDKYVGRQIETGMLKAEPVKLDISIRDKFSSVVGHFSDDGTKVVEMTHKFLELAEKRAITMAVDQDGSYRIDDGNTKTDNTIDSSVGDSVLITGQGISE
jgi:hypothetical protein